MAFDVNTSGRPGAAPVMNVTPLVDVVLVLLIIFMVITPLLTKKFWVHTPKQEKQQVENEVTKDTQPPLVLRVTADRSVSVNGTSMSFEEVPERLRRMFAAREDHILFFDAADAVPYGFAVELMDRAREGGAVTIAALAAPLESLPGDAPPGP